MLCVNEPGLAGYYLIRFNLTIRMQIKATQSHVFKPSHYEPESGDQLLSIETELKIVTDYLRLVIFLLLNNSLLENFGKSNIVISPVLSDP
jgi:hypothetical protein